MMMTQAPPLLNLKTSRHVARQALTWSRSPRGRPPSSSSTRPHLTLPQ